jgi:hypothetical protein
MGWWDNVLETIGYGKSENRWDQETRMAKKRAEADLDLADKEKRMELQLQRERQDIEYLSSVRNSKIYTKYLQYGGVIAGVVVGGFIIFKLV